MQELLDKVDNRTAVLNNRAAGAPEQVAALLATADALLEATTAAPLPLPPTLSARLPRAAFDCCG